MASTSIPMAADTSSARHRGEVRIRSRERRHQQRIERDHRTDRPRFPQPRRRGHCREHAFVVYKLMATLFGANTIEVPDPGFVHDLEAMAAAITPKTRMVFIANPNNPTGTMVDQAAIDRFMAKVPDHVVVIFDEAYYEFVPDAPDTLKYIREGRNVVIMRTFSKIQGSPGSASAMVSPPPRSGRSSRSAASLSTRTRSPRPAPSPDCSTRNTSAAPASSTTRAAPISRNRSRKWASSMFRATRTSSS